MTADAFVKPPPLRPGDRVAVVSSSWGGPHTLPAPYEAGLAVLRDELGLEVVESRTARMPADELARNPRLRAETMNELFTDDSIHAIIASIGGDDSVRILPWLDVDLALTNPKIMLGYSDFDTILAAYHLAGLITYNGPAVMSGFAQMGTFRDSLEHVRAMLFGAAGEGTRLPSFQQWTQTNSDWADPDPARATEIVGIEPHDGWRWLGAERTTRGRLFGGCIDVLEFLKGTRWWPNADPSWWRGRVLFLETSEEKPPLDTVRYWLRNYASQGVFEHAEALWFGRPRGYSDDEKEQLYELLVDVVSESGGELPIVANLDFGHTDPHWVLPLGIEVETDPARQTLTLGESPTA